MELVRQALIETISTALQTLLNNDNLTFSVTFETDKTETQILLAQAIPGLAKWSATTHLTAWYQKIITGKDSANVEISSTLVQRIEAPRPRLVAAKIAVTCGNLPHTATITFMPTSSTQSDEPNKDSV